MTRCWAALVVASALACSCAGAWAQYKVVDAQGRVTYTDTPPAAPTAARVTRLRGAGTAAAADGSAGPALPLALRTVVGRYPVTLYATADCAGCDTGRAQLQRRGIPFDERTVTTPEDAAALDRLTGSADLPALRIGDKTLRGHDPDGWDTYLTAAGYPLQSVLPAEYHPAAPQPLTRLPVNAPAAASSPDVSAPPAPVAPVAPPRTPGGIAF